MKERLAAAGKAMVTTANSEFWWGWGGIIAALINSQVPAVAGVLDSVAHAFKLPSGEALIGGGILYAVQRLSSKFAKGKQ